MTEGLLCSPPISIAALVVTRHGEPVRLVLAGAFAGLQSAGELSGRASLYPGEHSPSSVRRPFVTPQRPAQGVPRRLLLVNQTAQNLAAFIRFQRGQGVKGQVGSGPLLTVAARITVTRRGVPAPLGTINH